MKPSTIRLFDSSGTTVLDSISIEYEDSFCLETFGDLIETAKKSEPVGTKNFILARVQTWDPKQPDKAFYSYYHAHHLNRILFQTQIYLDKKLIHRLHVLNPLTNSDIIGNVLYFMVMDHPKNTNVQKSFPYDKIDIEKVLVPPSPTVNKIVLPPISSVEDIVQANIELHNNQESSKTWTLAGPRTEQVEAKEYEVLSPIALEKQASELKLRTSLGIRVPKDDLEANISQEQLLDQNRMNSRIDKKPKLSINTRLKQNNERPRSAGLASLKMSPVSLHFPQSAYPVIDRDPSLSIAKRKVEIPKGMISQRGSIVTENDFSPAVAPAVTSRRRQMSYINAIQSSGQNKKSLNEWQESIEENPALPNDHGSYDAYLIATDSDFLEQSRVRQIFRDNAINPSEAVLFEMAPYTGEETARRRITTEDLLCDSCLPTEHQLRHPNAFIRNYHQYKCYLFIIIVTAGVLALIWVVATNVNK